MRWIKRGPIFRADGRAAWMASHHAQLPVAVVTEDGRLRVYFSTRDQHNRSRSAFFDTDPGEPENVAYVHDRPALELGAPGAFDDSGVMASCVVETDGGQYLYYVGFTTRVDHAPYKTEIGLAVSIDGGATFTRTRTDPLLDRIAGERIGANSPFVLRESGRWRMWFGSFSGWDRTTERAEPVYSIRYAESADGVRWEPDDADCIEPRSDGEANARAWVVRERDTYRMWFSYRSILGFREDRDRSYRIGYAESDDGVNWERRDAEAGLMPSEAGWDSDMAAYASVYEHGGVKHMLYNGNGFGRSGIGHAIAA